MSTERLDVRRIAAGVGGGALVLAAALVLSAGWRPDEAGIFALLLRWTPHLVSAYGANLGMGAAAMIIATAGGGALGLLLASRPAVARPALWLTLGLRNLPWLAVIFFVMYLTPFEVEIGGRYVPVPGWAKTIFGLALPACGYVAEIVRGGISSVPTAQWEAAASLGLGRWQTLTRVILPIALRRMTPPWINMLCTVMLATSLGSVVGVEELLMAVQDLIASETRQDVAFWAYAYAMGLFFLTIQPAALLSRRLERQWRDS